MPPAIAHRKEIINKISVRSNRQNEIKKWDLVCNDDFQHELARYFRSRGYYYERRRHEWKSRRTELKSVGIEQGPDIRELTQLLACFHWRENGLGPVAARAPGELFDDAPYEIIRTTEPVLAYQIWWTAWYMDHSVDAIGATQNYVKSLSHYMRFALLSLIVRASAKANAKWGSSALTQALEADNAERYKEWRRLVELCIRQIREEFRGADQKTRKLTREPLSPANFFKAQRYVEPILRVSLQPPLVAAAKRVFAT